MDNEIKAWMHDILQSVNEIESYFEDSPKEFQSYANDIKLKRAIERNLEIIGEAVNRITKKNPDFVIENTREIIGTRNRIIHGYDAVSDEMIWSIVVNHLPELQSEINNLLAS